jgi:glutathione S-transferase
MTMQLYELVGQDKERPFSPHCWKAVMALEHKGLAFHTVPTAFTAIPDIEGGGHKTVPVLRDGDTIVSDSFAIAQYLERRYPDRPSLFGGAGGEATARFVERWCQTVVQAQMVTLIVKDIHDILGAEDQSYFRASREARFGRPLEEVPVGRDDRLAGFRAALEPLRSMLAFQPFIGGDAPLFADYIVFGAFQWARITSPFRLLADDDVVAAWFERCLDLHAARGRKVAAA